MSGDVAAQLQSVLRTQSIPVPSLAWLRAVVIPTRTPPPPLASLIATARARLLAADVTAPGLLDAAYAAAHALPESNTINNPAVDTARLGRDVVVQVLDVENLSRSRWEQVEELEAIERGEQTRGREVIRLPAAGTDGVGDDDDGDDDANARGGPGGIAAAAAAAAAARNATHKLVLQDCKGQKVCAVELKRVERIAVGQTQIGEKILLREDTKIARGVLLLEPANCHILGGRVEVWHKAWTEGRLARLREAARIEDR